MSLSACHNTPNVLLAANFLRLNVLLMLGLLLKYLHSRAIYAHTCHLCPIIVIIDYNVEQTSDNQKIVRNKKIDGIIQAKVYTEICLNLTLWKLNFKFSPNT